MLCYVDMLRANNQTGYKGVSYDPKRKRYRAYAMMGGYQQHLGYFSDVHDAGIAASDFRLQHAKELAEISVRGREIKSKSLTAWHQKHKATHCKRGHPYDEANTCVDSRGRRECIACRVERRGR